MNNVIRLLKQLGNPQKSPPSLDPHHSISTYLKVFYLILFSTLVLMQNLDGQTKPTTTSKENKLGSEGKFPKQCSYIYF